MFNSRSMLSVIGLVLLAFVGVAVACPFCSSVSQTFTEEFTGADVVVIADLIEVPEIPEEATDPNAPLPKAKFTIKSIIKGEDHVKVGDEVQVLFFGEGKKDRTYLLTGADPPNVMWSTPLKLSERAHEYVTKVLSLPEDASRLEFFQEYLEDEDEMLARDAYDEFAKTPYEGVIALKDKMHHDRLVEFIQSTDVPPSRRRLYFTMLGVCGSEEDAPMLRAIMKSDDRKTKAGMDAMLACFLNLTGEKGLAEVEELFLKNKAEYPDTYAAIMAIRFHGNETDKIEKKRLILALRHLLDRPDLADLVIRDLARWEDWEVMPRLVQLFKEADEKSSWVRVPIVNYLRSCPLPAAKQHIEELKKIDADAVRRAQTFYPQETDSAEDEQAAPAASDTSQALPMLTPGEAQLEPGIAQPTPIQPSPIQPAPIQPTPIQPQPNQPTQVVRAAGTETQPQISQAFATQPVVTATPATANAPQTTPADAPLETDVPASEQPQRSLAEAGKWQPNRAMLWGVPLVCGVCLLYLLRLVLGVPYGSQA